MFTGLIQDLGMVRKVHHQGRSIRLTIATNMAHDDVQMGESIAVDGACYTVVAWGADHFSVDVSSESLDRTTTGRLQAGDRVHLERALRLSDRLGGHLVLGHVDGVGQLTSRRTDANAVHLTFRAPTEVASYLIPKGCIAVDGVSLTVNTCEGDQFSVTIVPHTAEKTKLAELQPGHNVNLEADVVGKYVASMVAKLGLGPSGSDSLTALLQERGFIKD